MASTRFASRSTALARPRAAGVSKARYNELKARVSRVGKRAAEKAGENEQVLLGLGGAIGLGLLERSGKTLPTVMGLDPAIVGGAVGYFVGKSVKGKMGGRIKDASIGVLSVGAHRSTLRGSVKVGEDDDDDD